MSYSMLIQRLWEAMAYERYDPAYSEITVKSPEFAEKKLVCFTARMIRLS
jgi:hypothetical protein